MLGGAENGESQDAEQTVEVFENEIQMYLSMFCESNAIESEYDILPSQWNAALSYIYKHVIKPNPDILTIPHTVSNSYNINAVDDLLEMYIYMCYCHNQEISIKGFCLLSGNQEIQYIRGGIVIQGLIYTRTYKGIL